jgi:hypothetical protein
MKSLCRHAQKRSILIFLEPTEVGQHLCAVLTITCNKCGTPFEFVGVQAGPNVKISEDMRELRVSIAEAPNGMVQ